MNDREVLTYVLLTTSDYPTGINHYLILPSLDFADMSSVVKKKAET